MHEMRQLSLDYDSISNLGPLAEMTQLQMLSVDGLSGTLTNLVPISGLTELQTVSLSGQQVTDVSSLAALSDLERLNLRHNKISDIQSLTNVRIVDDGDPGYSETGSGWVGDKNPAAFDGDYRLHASGAGADRASWTFTNLPVGSYDVQVTWPAHDSQSSVVTYTVSNSAV